MEQNFNEIIDSANENAKFKMPQLDPKDYDSLECDKCGCVAFMPAMIIKKVPGAAFGSAHKTQLVPDQILVCAKCGTILKKDREYYNLSDDNKQNPKTEENKSSIII